MVHVPDRKGGDRGLAQGALAGEQLEQLRANGWMEPLDLQAALS
jgi:hypothetical protein